MAWLMIGPDTKVTLRLMEGFCHERRSHWVDGASHECGGAECVYCRAGSKIRMKWFMSVQSGGQDYTWEFPRSVLDQLGGMFGGPDKMSGATVVVARHGSGLATRYVVESGVAAGVSQSVGAAAGPGVGVVGGVAQAVPAAGVAAPCGLTVDEVRREVWSLLMSGEFLGAVAGAVVWALCDRGDSGVSWCDKMVLQLGVGVGSVLQDYGVLPGEEPGAPVGDVPGAGDGGS